MSLKIIKAGLLDTVQDGGRYRYQHLGINPGGAMDRYAAGLANALLGKKATLPVIELHFPAAKILFQQPTIICVTGADFSPCINGEEVPLNQPVAINSNTVLSFQKKRSGERCYLAVLHEFKLEPWLKSYSTNLKAAAGGYKGRALTKDDVIEYRGQPFLLQNDSERLPWKYKAEQNNMDDLHVITGPEWSWLTEKSKREFFQTSFTVTPASDRMGYRLQGVALKQELDENLISSGVGFGTVQLLPNGQLIVLMADHQTTGGYPRIATIIAAHLPRLAQKNAGQRLTFVLTSVEAAEAKWIAQQKYLDDLQNTCKLKLQNRIHAH